MKTKEYIFRTFILAAACLATGCGQSDYAGYIKLHHDACEASNGIYEILENGKDRCSCFFKDDGEPYPCPEEFVCDSAHQRCIKCEEGKTFCVDGTLHICLNGDWQKQPCESDTCLNKNSCAPTSLKPMCCKDANGNSICGELVSDNGILVVTGNAYALDECANGCENGECLPCNGFQTRCEEHLNGDNTTAELISCQNGFNRIFQCSSQACNDARTGCKENIFNENDCTGFTGMTRCVDMNGQWIQQTCQNNIWTFQKNCEYGCNAEMDACGQITSGDPCLENKYKCEYQIESQQYILYECKGGKWDNGILCPYGCEIDDKSGDGYCKPQNDVQQQSYCTNGYYSWDNQKQTVMLCANNTWTEDIPKYNQLIFYTAADSDSSNVYVCTQSSKKFIFITGLGESDLKAMLQVLDILPPFVMTFEEIYPNVCNDGVYFSQLSTYERSFAMKHIPEEKDQTMLIKKCQYGCNSNRTMCAEDVANATQDDIFMSYYDTKEEPFDIELANKGNKFKETQCTSKGSLQYVCSGSDHQNALGNQFCIDAYDSKTYVRTSFQVEVQTNTATRKYKLTKCNSKNNTNRCNADWSACAVD